MRDGVNRSIRRKEFLGLLFISMSLLSGVLHAKGDEPTLHFNVERFDVQGNVPFSAAQIQTIMQPFTGKHAGLEGLQAAGDALKAALRKAGYPFYEVNLPPQTLLAGVVRLDVIAQQLGEIRVQGNEHYGEDNIKESLPLLVAGSALNTHEISRAILLANENPAKTVKVSFSDGGRVGQLKTKIKVEDERPWNFFTSVSNTGANSTTGKWRHALGFQHNNVFGKDHTYSTSLTYAPGKSSVISQIGFSYRIPLYRQKAALTLFLSKSDFDLDLGNAGLASAPGAAGSVNLLGGGQVSGFKLSRPLLNIGRYKHSIAMSYEDKLIDQTNATTGQSLIQQTGKRRATPLSLNYEAAYQHGKTAWMGGVQYVKNLELNNYNEQKDYGVAANSPDVDWDLWRANVVQDVTFGPSWLWRLQLSGQSAEQILSTSEQYGLGGATTVRGYTERVLSGDDALVVRNELWFKALGKNKVRPLFFYDWGSVYKRFDSAISASSYTEIAGFGLGLRYQWKSKLSIVLDVARAREGISTVEGGHVHGHFNLFARF